MKILVDMNLPPDWVAFLSDNGVDATHPEVRNEVAILDNTGTELLATCSIPK